MIISSKIITRATHSLVQKCIWPIFSQKSALRLGLKWGIYELDKIDKMRLIWKIHHPPYVLMLALFDDVSKSMSHLYSYLYKPIFPFVAPYGPNIWPWNPTLIWAYWKYMRFLWIFNEKCPENGYFMIENIQFIKKIIWYLNFLYMPYNMASYIQKSSKVMWPKSCDWNHVTVISSGINTVLEISNIYFEHEK